MHINPTHVSLTKCDNYDTAIVKPAIIRLFDQMGLSKDNPLGSLINPGDNVVLKPNWIKECHEHDPNEWQSIVTNPCVIECLLEFVLIALCGEGKVAIMDGPQTDSSFSKIMAHMDADNWIRKGRTYGIEVDLLDLREDEWLSKGDIIVERKKLPGDPKGSVIVDLQEKSAFADKPVPPLGYYGADYKCDETTWAHSDGRNLYKVSRSAIEADVFINLPKLKTHRKAGMTVCMKNLVGINTYKNYLPHHSQGTPVQGGDQFPAHTISTVMERSVVAKLKKIWANYPSLSRCFIPVKYVGKKIFGDSSETIRSGSWYGNDTLWRMVVDLNRVLFYANSDDTLKVGNFCLAKRYFALVDGVIAGEGCGPMAPDRKNASILMAGFNPLAVDCVAAKMMGLDYQKIHYLREAFKLVDYPIADFNYDDIKVCSDNKAWDTFLKDISYVDTYKFRPAPGWVGHIEEDSSN